jgi:hypothetical protein
MEPYQYDIYNDTYYVPPKHNLISFRYALINKNKELIKYSTFYSTYSSDYNKEKELFDTNVDFQDVNIIDTKIIMATYWPECYGHVFDTIYVLYNFYLNTSIVYSCDYKYMLCIPPQFNNLIILANFLFGEKLINSSSLNQNKLIKMNKVVLIKNHADMKYFFDYNNNIITNTIRAYYDDDKIEQYDNVFLTRSINNCHDNRSVIENLKDVENFFSKHNFKIIDPSKTTDKILYNHIKNCKNMIVTNGSTLTSLIILKPNIRIFCLNSKRYLPNWRKEIKNNKEYENIIQNNKDLLNDNFEKHIWYPTTKLFDFMYIDSFNNIITTEQLDFIIQTISPT